MTGAKKGKYVCGGEGEGKQIIFPPFPPTPLCHIGFIQLSPVLAPLFLSRNPLPVLRDIQREDQKPTIQLFRERLSEKVHVTTLEGIVGGFEFTVLQRNFKELHERSWTYFVCKC